MAATARRIGGAHEGSQLGRAQAGAARELADELVRGQVSFRGQVSCMLRPPHAILCGADRDGLRLRYGNRDVEHVTPQVRADVHAAITTRLEWDLPVHIQDLVDRGAIQTHRTDAARSSTDPSRRSYRDSRK
ncbi:hypothetical protein ACFCXH_39015 [Streptomyces nojiriensis]|uniref:hypothetical protein n=1 Tax=Streptomyces nojiriensis TaxID=66374 RepID=UPI0035DA4906